MPNDDYTELRAWLERMGALRAGTLACLTAGEAGLDYEAWSYGDYAFILARERKGGVTTGGVTLFSRVNDKDAALGDDTAHLRIQFRAEDIRREKLKHRASNANACALAETADGNVHYCNMDAGHESFHRCACGAGWSQHEGDNALLTHPADTKKKPERVRGFTI